VVHPLITGIIIAVISNAAILLTCFFQALRHKLMEPALKKVSFFLSAAAAPLSFGAAHAPLW
jgi:hypothetical protein